MSLSWLYPHESWGYLKCWYHVYQTRHPTSKPFCLSLYRVSLQREVLRRTCYILTLRDIASHLQHQACSSAFHHHGNTASGCVAHQAGYKTHFRDGTIVVWPDWIHIRTSNSGVPSLTSNISWPESTPLAASPPTPGPIPAWAYLPMPHPSPPN